MRFVSLLVVAAAFSFIAYAQDRFVETFTLRNVDGKMVSLDEFPEAKGFIVVFTCNHCPFAKLYPSRFNQLNSTYGPKGVPLLAVNSMDSVLYEEESFVWMQRKAKAEKYNFPYLQDADQTVGKHFGAAHTPEAFIIWKENGKYVIKYEGAIDDNGEDASKALPFVANAVDQLLAGKTVSNPKTDSFGCRIFYRK